MQKIEVERVLEAPIETVFDRYTDHVSWTEWAKMGRVRLERRGEPEANGVGCVRAISSAGVTVYEEVLAFERLRRMTYRVVRGGIPMRDHLGDVLFEKHERGTRIVWRCQFESRIPGLGFVFRAMIASLFRRALAGLARDLARGAAPGRRA